MSCSVVANKISDTNSAGCYIGVVGYSTCTMAARPLILPETFSGLEQDWNDWIDHFENVAAVKGSCVTKSADIDVRLNNTRLDSHVLSLFFWCQSTSLLYYKYHYFCLVLLLLIRFLTPTQLVVTHV